MSTTNVKDVKAAHEKCEMLVSMLKKEPWFKKEGWVVRSGDFPPNDPDCVSINIFKKHWFEGRIHIETYFGYRGTYLKKSYVTVHISYEPVITRTTINRIKISKPFSAKAIPIVKKWQGYTISAGKYGKQPFTFKLVAGPDMVAIIHKEISRICRELGGIMDEAI